MLWAWVVVEMYWYEVRMKWQKFDPNNTNPEGIQRLKEVHSQLEDAIKQLKITRQQLKEKSQDGEMAERNSS